MALNLASPGIVVKEIDLTKGGITAATSGVGAIVAPFAQGPTDVPTIVGSENDLLNIFGQPYTVDKHYEHWMVASSYLAYGGQLQVVRADSTNLKNAFVGSATSIKIKSLTDYNNLGYDVNTISGVTVAANNPGSWANGIKVAIIDGLADQTLGISTSGIFVGYGVTQALTGTLPGVGSTTPLSGYLKGIVTQVGSGTVSVKILSQVSTGNTVTNVDYQPSGTYAFNTSSNISFINNSSVGVATITPNSVVDWYDQQTISLTNSTIYWNSIATRPVTSSYAASRGSRFDQLNIAVFDDAGVITGNAGTILEKHLSISKGTDAEFSVGAPAYWRSYLATNSNYIFGGSQPATVVATSFSPTTGYTVNTAYGWDQATNNIVFGGAGANTYTLGGGLDYSGVAGVNTATPVSGSLTATLAGLTSGYQKFLNSELYQINFLLMGSANYDQASAQAIASQLIAVAEERKDCVAFISPYRKAFLNDTSSGSVTINSDATITDNVIAYQASIPSSTYAVIDSTYKYMYDRYSNTFRYIPMNGDIAGLCARNDANNFPWYSPAGTSRGSILNAVKLTYNPTRTQRDRLYTNRINPIIFSPGAGIILFGDKTASGYVTAFDRINVRRLFIYLEQVITKAAKDKLFEFNDTITRTDFVNIVEPFLRDVQAKRGIYDFVVICDTSNNTAAIIDSNEFVADIYIKPARSINFIGLTFVATRTGVAFSEVIGKF
jgi:Phage tail sheath protein subtilisin-like domain/Phage tail sheath C-terminal domain